MLVITCHGNSATEQSFNYIKACMPQHEFFDLSYDSRMGFWNNLDAMEDILSYYPDEEFVFLAHSLGGVYAAYLASFYRKRTLAMITMATPYGGCEAATLLDVVVPSQLFRDIKTNSDVMRGIKSLSIKCPVTALVTTAGQSSLWTKENDGVISRESMLALKGNVKYYDVHATHSEILLSNHMIEIVEQAVGEACNVLTNEMESV